MENTHDIKDYKESMNNMVKLVRHEGVDREDVCAIGFFSNKNKCERFILIKNGDVRSTRKLEKGK